MDNKLQCKRCGKPIKGGCYNTPDGPFCVDCWENKISEKTKKNYEKQALKRLQTVGIGLKKKLEMSKIHLCGKCKYCTHSPNLFQPYYWCSWYGKEVRSQINRCNNITFKAGKL